MPRQKLKPIREKMLTVKTNMEVMQTLLKRAPSKVAFKATVARHLMIISLGLRGLTLLQEEGPWAPVMVLDQGSALGQDREQELELEVTK